MVMNFRLMTNAGPHKKSIQPPFHLLQKMRSQKKKKKKKGSQPQDQFTLLISFTSVRNTRAPYLPGLFPEQSFDTSCAMVVVFRRYIFPSEVPLVLQTQQPSPTSGGGSYAPAGSACPHCLRQWPYIHSRHIDTAAPPCG